MEVHGRVGPGELGRLLGDWVSQGRGSLSRRLGQSLRAVIAAGHLPAGTRLPAERRLADALAVSRSTIVGALDELRAEGLVVSRPGSGTRVAGESPLPAPGDQLRAPSAVDRLLGPGGVDLAISVPPDAGHLPDLGVAFADLLAAVPAHGYEPAGLFRLRAAAAERLTAAGLVTDPAQLQVTHGGQHGIDLALGSLTRPGERVLVEDPTYPGALDVLTRHQLVPVAVPALPGDGLAGAVRSALAVADRRPVAAYLQPAVHNPTGRVLSDRARRDLARAVDVEGFVVVEDQTLADLAFDRKRPPSLAQLCRRASVVSVESLSKVAWGGLRTGWLRAPAPLAERLVRPRHHRDLGTSVAAQLLALQLLGQLDALAAERRAVLARRAGELTARLTEALPDWEITPPAGGLSLWVRLPGVPALAFVPLAVRHGVRVAPGDAASPAADTGREHLRLCFDRRSADLEWGVAALAAAWADARRSPTTIG